MSDVNHNVQYELHEPSDYLENLKTEEVLNICKKFIDIMKQKKSDYDLQVHASEILYTDIPSYFRIVFQTLYHNNNDIIYPLYTCPGRKMSDHQERSYRRIFKIASPENKTVVLFYYLKDKDGYAPIAAIRETNSRIISQQKLHTQKLFDVLPNSESGILLTDQDYAEKMWILHVGNGLHEITNDIPDELRILNKKELYTICQKFLRIMKKLVADFKLLPPEFEVKYISSEEKLWFENHKCFSNSEHTLYSCVGEKERYQLKNDADMFKIASVSTDMVILFQNKRNEKRQKCYVPIAVFQKNGLFYKTRL